MENANIKDYIFSKIELEHMPFGVVYSTIMALINDGIITRDAFDRFDYIRHESQR